MTTSEGRIGIAPKAARQGDIICILFWSRTPMVVRPIVRWKSRVIMHFTVLELALLGLYINPPVLYYFMFFRQLLIQSFRSLL